MSDLKKLNGCFQKLRNKYLKSYSNKEWLNRVDLYFDCLDDALMPFLPTTVELKELTYKLDIIYNEAVKDHTLIANKCNKLNAFLDLRKKDYYIQARAGTLKAFPNQKATSDELAKNMAILAIEKEPYIVQQKNNISFNAFEVQKVFNERLQTLNAIMNAIKTKKDFMILNSSMLKIESSLES